MEYVLYNSIFSKIEKEINSNKNVIMNMQKIDNKYCKIKIEINKLIEIIEYYKNRAVNGIKDSGRKNRELIALQ